MGKLQITFLKFWGIWNLHFKISEFGNFFLKFGDVWNLQFVVLEFIFYLLKFGVFEFYNSKILKF